MTDTNQDTQASTGSPELSFEPTIHRLGWTNPAAQARDIWGFLTAHYKQVIADKDAEIATEKERVLHYRQECQKYRDIIDNGLGPEDMQDDH